MFRLLNSIRECVAYIPSTVGSVLRYWLLKASCKRCGNCVYVGQGTMIYGCKRLCIGNNVEFLARSYINAQEGHITIGDRVSFNVNNFIACGNRGEIVFGSDIITGPNVVFAASDHTYKDLSSPIKTQEARPGKIVIEDDVWIGANVVVTRDVRIGKGAIVGAGSVVTHSVDSYSIVGGVPTRVIGSRK